MVNFVATTHPMGQKRCYRGDGSQISFRTQRTLRNQGPFDIYKWFTRPVHWGRLVICTLFTGQPVRRVHISLPVGGR